MSELKPCDIEVMQMVEAIAFTKFYFEHYRGTTDWETDPEQLANMVGDARAVAESYIEGIRKLNEDG